MSISFIPIECVIKSLTKKINHELLFSYSFYLFLSTKKSFYNLLIRTSDK